MKTIQTLAVWALYTGCASAQQFADPCGSITVTRVSQEIPCATIGALVVDPDLSGALELHGVIDIAEFLMIDNKGLLTLSSTSLSRIGDDFYVDGAASLTEISLPNLTNVNRLGVVDAPKLDYMTIGGEKALASIWEVSVINTAVATLDLHVNFTQYLSITNNTHLSQLFSPVQIIGDGIFRFNGNYFTVTLHELVSATSLVISHAAAVRLKSLVSVGTTFAIADGDFDSDSDGYRLPSFDVPSLETVGGSLSVVNNIDLANINFPLLKNVSGSLSMINNSANVEINFPRLDHVGGNLTVAGNLGIEELDGFPELSDVSEKVVLNGSFKYLEMPNLSNAAGGLWVTSSENISYSCAALEKTFQSERPHQSFECQGAEDEETGSGESSPTGTNPGQDGEETPSTQPLSGGVIAGIVVGALAAVGILAAVLFIVWKRRRKGAAVEERTPTTEAGDLQDPKYTYIPPDELQGVPRSEIASPDPELEGSRVPKGEDTIYYEVDGTARRAA